MSSADFENQVRDFFTVPELVEYLDIGMDDAIYLFFDEIHDAREDLEELMGVKSGNS